MLAHTRSLYRGVEVCVKNQAIAEDKQNWTVGDAKPLVVINSMFGNTVSIRNAVALYLAMSVPCQAVFAAYRTYTPDCRYQCECEENSKCKPPCNSLYRTGCVCSSRNNTQPQSQSCNCECHKLPLEGLPLSQQNSRSLSEILRCNASALSCALSNIFDLSHETTFAGSQSSSNMMQQPCILFCRFLL